MRKFTNLVFPKKKNRRDAYLVTSPRYVHILSHIGNNNNPIVRDWNSDLYRTPSGQILEVDSLAQLAFIDNGKVLVDSNKAKKFFTDDANSGYMLFVRSESTFNALKNSVIRDKNQITENEESIWVLFKSDSCMGKLEHFILTEYYKNKLAEKAECQVFNNFEKAMKAMHDVIDSNRLELYRLTSELKTNTNLIQNWVNRHSLEARIKEKAFNLLKACIPGTYYAFSKDTDFNSRFEGTWLYERRNAALHHVNLTLAKCGVKENTLYAFTDNGDVISNEKVLLLTEKDYNEIVLPIINDRNVIYAMRRLLEIYRGRYAEHAYSLDKALNDENYRGGFNMTHLKEMVNETSDVIKRAQKYNVLK